MLSLNAVHILPGEVHVFFSQPRQNGHEFREAWSVLDQTERLSASRIQDADKRTAYVMAHGLLRIGLSRFAGIDPPDLRFSRDAYGKPGLDAGQVDKDLRFSLTHTKDLVGCAIALDKDVGFDLELQRDPPPLQLLAYFAPQEQAAVRALPNPAQADAFYALWTLKEAYAKAVGRGLTLPLDSFWIDMTSAGPPRLGQPAPGHATTWTLSSWRRGAHWAGLAVDVVDAKIRIHG